MKSWKIRAAVVVLTIALTGFLSFWLTQRTCWDAMQIFRQAELSRAADRAAAAYFTQSPAVVQWELTHFLQRLESTGAHLLKVPDMLRFYKFVTASRLAKLCLEIGDSNGYERYLSAALEYGKPLFGGTLNDASALFAALEKIDETARGFVGRTNGFKEAVRPRGEKESRVPQAEPE